VPTNSEQVILVRDLAHGNERLISATKFRQAYLVFIPRWQILVSAKAAVICPALRDIIPIDGTSRLM
jgi:hypothetical protein